MNNIIMWDGEFIEASEPKPCTICGKPTKFIEICYESPYCSKECLEIEDKRCEEWCENHPMIEEEEEF